jgi:hypothetical protein
MAVPLHSPAKTALSPSKSADHLGGTEMRAKVQMAREKVVAAAQLGASRSQPSAAADLISAATTSMESRERCGVVVRFIAWKQADTMRRKAAVLPPGSNKYTQPKVAADE